MARVESGYQLLESPTPPSPHRPSLLEEQDIIASLPPSTPPHTKRGILRNPSSDSLFYRQSSSSIVSNHGDFPGDRRDSKQVCFTDIQPVSDRQTDSPSDRQADSPGDVHVGGSDSKSGDSTNDVSDGDLHDSTTADACHVDAAEVLNDRTDDGHSMMEGGLLLGEVGEGEPRPNRPPRQVPPPLSKLKKLQSQLDFDQLAKNELELKANLYFHIGNPIKRWRVERVVPIKLLLQLLKTFCLIVQVTLFTLTIGHQRSKFFFESRKVFENLFLKNFDPEDSRTTYTVYTIPDVLEEIDHIATRYHKLPDITLGGYDFFRDENESIVPLRLHLRQLSEATLNATTFSYVLNGSIVEVPFSIGSLSEKNASTQLLEHANDPFFHRFVDLEISISVKNIRIVDPALAECFLFNIQIVFRKEGDSGKVNYALSQTTEKQTCHGVINTPTTNVSLMAGFLTLLDAIMMCLCCISLFLTVSSLRRATKLGRAMGSFYHNELNLPLSWWERRSLFSPFHLVNVLSDLVIIIGTLLKILLAYNVIIDASVTRVFLGTALVFQAVVILRYVSYFNELNALTRTLVLAVPELLKFLLCAGILFIAFSLCGWIVLGPYHIKFGDPNASIESLFCLLNGDDIYNTYIQLSLDDDAVAYIYSRVFLYVFTALFTYAVLNLFTSLVISAYEVSQGMDTATQNEVRRFVFSGPLTPHGVALRDVTITRKFVDPSVVKHKSIRKRRRDEDDCM